MTDQAPIAPVAPAAPVAAPAEPGAGQSPVNLEPTAPAAPPVAPESFEVDGVNYSADQIRELNQGGMRAADYTRKTQELAAERKEVETAKAELNKPAPAELSPEDQVKKIQAISTLEKYGVATKADLETMRKEERQRYDDQTAEAENKRLSEQAGEIVGTAVSTLSTQYDGVDGKPKFDPKEVGTWMEDHGMGTEPKTFQKDMEMAYKMMHYDALLSWDKKNPNSPQTNPTQPGAATPIINEGGKELDSFDDAGKALYQHLDKLGL